MPLKEQSTEESYDRDHFLEAFSKRFQQALIESGYQSSDQARLASELGVSRQAIRKWLEGKSLPSATRLPVIAQKLKVRHSWLATGEPPIRAITANIINEQQPAEYHKQATNSHVYINHEEMILLQQYRKLSKEAQTVLNNLISLLS